MRNLPLAILAAALLLTGCETPPRSAPQASAPPAPAPAAPPPQLDPAPQFAELLNRQTGAVRAALGQPDFVRREPGAEIWRYGGDGCTLLVIFYEEGEALRASHIDARSPGGGAADTQACVASVNRALQLGSRAG